jgi:N6-adenosine-specific RNA methylase IME4
MKLPATYSAALRALALANTDEVKEIHNQAIAMEVYAYKAKDAELVRLVVEIRKRAEQRLGQLMKAAPKAKGAAQPGVGRRGKNAGFLKTHILSLAKQGVDKNLADRARKAAAMTEQQFEASIARAIKLAIASIESANEVIKAAREEALRSKLQNRARRHEEIRSAATSSPHLEHRRFPLIYVDPPWHFQTYTPAGGGRAPDNHYPTLSDDEIIDFTIDGRPMCEVAHKDAALFLWCTSSNIRLALQVMESWGFTFKASAVWVKDKQGTGLIFRNWHEVLLYGSRGKMPGPTHIPPSVFHFARGRHSAKPPEIRLLTEKMYPSFDASSRLELFARGHIDGWTTFGLESLQVAA